MSYNNGYVADDYGAYTLSPVTSTVPLPSPQAPSSSVQAWETTPSYGNALSPMYPESAYVPSPSAYSMPAYSYSGNMISAADLAALDRLDASSYNPGWNVVYSKADMMGNYLPQSVAATVLDISASNPSPASPGRVSNVQSLPQQSAVSGGYSGSGFGSPKRYGVQSPRRTVLAVGPNGYYQGAVDMTGGCSTCSVCGSPQKPKWKY